MIGVGDYTTLPRLENPGPDARAVAHLLEAELGFRVTLLVDAEASAGAVEDAIGAHLSAGHDASQWLF